MAGLVLIAMVLGVLFYRFLAFITLVCERDDVCGPLVEAGVNATCYKGPYVVKNHFKSCDAGNV